MRWLVASVLPVMLVVLTLPYETSTLRFIESVSSYVNVPAPTLRFTGDDRFVYWYAGRPSPPDTKFAAEPRYDPFGSRLNGRTPVPAASACAVCVRPGVVR